MSTHELSESLQTATLRDDHSAEFRDDFIQLFNDIDSTIAVVVEGLLRQEPSVAFEGKVLKSFRFSDEGTRAFVPDYEHAKYWAVPGTNFSIDETHHVLQQYESGALAWTHLIHIQTKVELEQLLAGLRTLQASL